MTNTDVPLKSVPLADVGDARLAPFGACFRLTPDPDRVRVPLDFDGQKAAGAATLTIITAPSARRAGAIGRLERHPLSVQAFIPLAWKPVVTILAPAGVRPRRADQLTAFIVPTGHGIAYRPGVWHCGLMGFEGDVPVASFVHRMADGSDTEVVDLSFRVRIAELT
jgi:ureidoglycolate hydrolase